MKSYPLDPRLTPVNSDADLADWLGVDISDPLLPTMNAMATSAVVEYLRFELVSRERVVVYQHWPLVGTVSPVSISRQYARVLDTVELPYAKVLESVTSVTTSGELNTDYQVQDTTPISLRFETIPINSVAGVPAVAVRYIAGYGTTDDVPQPVKSAALMAADYYYTNRGGCTAQDALTESGAASILGPYRIKPVLF